MYVFVLAYESLVKVCHIVFSAYIHFANQVQNIIYDRIKAVITYNGSSELHKQLII